MKQKKPKILSILIAAGICLSGLSVWAGDSPQRKIQKITPLTGTIRQLIDLTITKLEVVPDVGTELIAGQKAWIKATWLRTGPQPKAVFRLGFKINGVFKDGSVIGSTVDHTLVSTTLSSPWYPPAGLHSIYARVDTENVVVESSELNNSKTIRVKVKPAPRPTIDLTISKLEVVPDTGTVLIAGRKAWIKATMVRTGPQPASEYRIGIKLDGSPLGSALGSTVDPVITNCIHSHPWYPPAGGHVIFAKVDNGDVITETSETNNTRSIRIYVKPALLPLKPVKK